ncbi:hypothetical protein POM88_001552 [Heracleum sosnowskyi]|uniref:Uncharacterized protein n=1 Tax=Heracleum sosnowskyi TaxID=360622 RepID=A0AAD8JCR7_9APIA|nr:hypothetical protein POM88_001552 [Heracleum sosnowskyi]
MKSLFSFYKRDGSDSTRTPAPASSNSVPVTPHQPNHLPIDEMEVIVETPNKPANQTDPGLRDPICTFPVNQQDLIRMEITQLLQGMMIDKELAGSIRGDAKVSSTKTLLQALRDDGWANFLQSVQQFVDDHGLEMPNMGAAYSMGTGRGCLLSAPNASVAQTGTEFGEDDWQC